MSTTEYEYEYLSLEEMKALVSDRLKQLEAEMFKYQVLMVENQCYRDDEVREANISHLQTIDEIQKRINLVKGLIRTE